MRKIVLSMNVTLDGCCDHTQVVADEELHRYATDLLAQSDAVLFGRVTYELFERHWPLVAREGLGPPSVVEFARGLDGKPKFVVSRTLDDVAWRNTSLLKTGLARDVLALKRDGGSGNLLIFGSPGLAAALARLGLIDEYDFLIQPIVAGRGPRLFDRVERFTVRLVQSRPFASGVSVLRCRPAPPPAGRDLLIDAYDAFNTRDLDAVLAVMHPDVDWPNGWEGGWVHGRVGVRDYWTRQWAAVDPHVEPVAFGVDDDGRTVTTVHQVVRDLSGKVILDGMVEHAYLIENGSIKRMEIRAAKTDLPT